MAYDADGFEGDLDAHDPDDEVDGGDPYVISLSQAQVDRVIRGALEEGNLSVMLAGIRDARELIASERSQLQDNRLSQSLLSGLLTLAAFPSDGRWVSTAELSRSLALSTATVHRYIATLEAIGLVEREPGSRRYRLV